VLKQHDMTEYEKLQVQLQAVLTSSVYGVEWPSYLTQGAGPY